MLVPEGAALAESAVASTTVNTPPVTLAVAGAGPPEDSVQLNDPLLTVNPKNPSTVKLFTADVLDTCATTLTAPT